MQSEGNKISGIIGFPGMGPWRTIEASAVTRRKTTTLESNHYEGRTPVFNCTTSTKNTQPGAIQLGTAWTIRGQIYFSILLSIFFSIPPQDSILRRGVYP